MSTDLPAGVDNDLDRRVRANQERLTADLKERYEFIICGARDRPARSSPVGWPRTQRSVCCVGGGR
jgi:hypothetical protein